MEKQEKSDTKDKATGREPTNAKRKAEIGSRGTYADLIDLN